VGVQSNDSKLAEAVRGEVADWHPPRGPDLHDLMLRAGHSAWRAQVALASMVGAAVVAVLLVLAVATVLLAPTLPGGEVVKEHLVQAP
jgi:hypothetical protein